MTPETRSCQAREEDFIRCNMGSKRTSEPKGRQQKLEDLVRARSRARARQEGVDEVGVNRAREFL